jgi:hypothetical protein
MLVLQKTIMYTSTWIVVKTLKSPCKLLIKWSFSILKHFQFNVGSLMLLVLIMIIKFLNSSYKSFCYFGLIKDCWVTIAVVWIQQISCQMQWGIKSSSHLLFNNSYDFLVSRLNIAKGFFDLSLPLVVSHKQNPWMASHPHQPNKEL